MKEENQNLDDIVKKWWNNGQPDSLLDLTSVPHEMLEEIPNKIDAVKASHLRHLKLPGSLNRLNVSKLIDWLPHLRNLKSLSLPDYQDTFLDLKNFRPGEEKRPGGEEPSYELNVYGSKIRYIVGSERARIYSFDAPKDVKVKARYYWPNEKDPRYKGTAMGYKRQVTPENKKKYIQVNINTEPLTYTCVNFALHYASLRRLYRYKLIMKNILVDKKAPLSSTSIEGNHASKLLDHISTTESAEQDISPLTNLIYDKLLSNGADNHLVGFSQLGRFLENISNNISQIDEEHYLEGTGSHAFHWYLRRKTTPIGEQYVLAETNPNKTIIYNRIVVHLPRLWLSIVTQSMYSWRDEEDMHHHGKFNLTSFTKIPYFLHNLNEQKIIDIFDDEKQRRQTTLYLSKDESQDVAKRFFWLRNNLPINGILEDQEIILANLPTAEKRANYLLAYNDNMWTARSVGLQRDSAEALRDDNALLIKAMENQWINEDLFYELVSAKNPYGIPGRYIALRHGSWQALRADNELLVIAMEKRWLNNQQFYELLQAKNDKGVTGRWRAIEEGHITTLQIDSRFLIFARERGWLDNQQLLELLIPSQISSIDQFEQLPNDIKKIQAHTILVAYANGWISDEQLDRIIPNRQWLEKNCPCAYATARTKLLMQAYLDYNNDYNNTKELKNPGYSFCQFTNQMREKSLKYSIAHLDRFDHPNYLEKTQRLREACSESPLTHATLYLEEEKKDFYNSGDPKLDSVSDTLAEEAQLDVKHRLKLIRVARREMTENLHQASQEQSSINPLPSTLYLQALNIQEQRNKLFTISSCLFSCYIQKLRQHPTPIKRKDILSSMQLLIDQRIKLIENFDLDLNNIQLHIDIIKRRSSNNIETDKDYDDVLRKATDEKDSLFERHIKDLTYMRFALEHLSTEKIAASKTSLIQAIDSKLKALVSEFYKRLEEREKSLSLASTSISQADLSAQEHHIQRQRRFLEEWKHFDGYKHHLNNHDEQVQESHTADLTHLSQLKKQLEENPQNERSWNQIIDIYKTIEAKCQDINQEISHDYKVSHELESDLEILMPWSVEDIPKQLSLERIEQRLPYKLKEWKMAYGILTTCHESLQSFIEHIPEDSQAYFAKMSTELPQMGSNVDKLERRFAKQKLFTEEQQQIVSSTYKISPVKKTR